MPYLPFYLFISSLVLLYKIKIVGLNFYIKKIEFINN